MSTTITTPAPVRVHPTGIALSDFNDKMQAEIIRAAKDCDVSVEHFLFECVETVVASRRLFRFTFDKMRTKKRR